MRLYLCGPAEPCHEAREARFAVAADHLTAMGHTVFSPYTSGLTDLARGDIHRRTEIDTEHLRLCDAVVTLPGTDEGQYEVLMAGFLRRPVITFAQAARALAV